jgi:hypothetical protein
LSDEAVPDQKRNDLIGLLIENGSERRREILYRCAGIRIDQDDQDDLLLGMVKDM